MTQNPTPKAGRNLPAAIIVGVAMLVSVLVGLLLIPLAFVLLVTVFAVFGVWEVSRAMGVRGIHMPIVPVLVGSLAMPLVAYFGGTESLMFALTGSAVAVLLWRSLEPAEGAAQSIFAGIFTLCWVPFFISFAILPLHAAETVPTALIWPGASVPFEALQIAVTLLLVVANDTFGYLVGVLFGRHPMAPKISPKKSWEGFAGSIAGAMVVGLLASLLLLDMPWWSGLIIAAGLVAAATAGDLAESMVKRELGIKDMSSILPGHGGMMDRLDSILFASPVAYLLFLLLGHS
ncbi:phosphatidate cytidylyltransferase [Paenarthrobacter sp. DKR-5]|uniref:phosphatidate cytidylyltransferase n=1 Tax=Paenarthrobacter sp. DKR-5 TaxID=2835535 RepID=UPI002028C405|nr:phosphatidate cytidylyltransferase [Paenarthrobacter sp. DKR-5]